MFRCWSDQTSRDTSDDSRKHQADLLKLGWNGESLRRQRKARCSNICAVLLVPRFHPLIEEPPIFKELNSATAWLCADRPICFEIVEVSYPDDESGDFTFRPDRSID
jgi:hypothetical protein